MTRAASGTATRQVTRKAAPTRGALKLARPARARNLAVSGPPSAAQADWSTPALLRLGLYAALIATALLTAAALLGAFTARNALRTVGREAAPGVFTAERIRCILEDMDQGAVDEFLSRGAAPSTFDARRQEASDAVISAAENISYRDVERVPLQKLALGLGSYTAQIQQARDQFKSGDKSYLDAYRRAALILDVQLLPAAAGLESTLADRLEYSYVRDGKMLQTFLSLVKFAGVLTGVVLLAFQFFLATRMRRLVNPGLFAATFVTFVFSVYAAQSLQNEMGHFASAKQGDFDQERAVLASRGSAKAAVLQASRHKLDAARFAGFLKAPANANAPDEPLSAETRERDFQQAIDSGFQDVAGFEVSAPAAAILILLLTFLGVLPRLREYSA